MKTIIAGGRTIHCPRVVGKAVGEAARDGWIKITEVVSGCAAGVDQLGELWASLNKIPIKRFPADWNSFGRAAGPKRNRHMADYADALIAIWDGKSKGTENMIKAALQLGRRVYVYRTDS